MKYTQLLKAIDATSQHLVGRAAAAVNQALVIRNWLIGAYIVEFEQHGEDRARYGQRLYARLATDLHAGGAQGCGERMLQQMAQFYRVYPQFGPGIPQPVVAELQKLAPIIFGKPLTAAGDVKKSSPAVRKSADSPIPQPLATEFVPTLPFHFIGDSVTTGDRIGVGKRSKPGQSTSSADLVASPDLILRFSWSQLLELIRIEDPIKRAFYENECLKGNWSKRQLQRQIGSLLFERTGLSKDKAAVIRRANRQESAAPVVDLLRDPYILEFTGLAERAEYAYPVALPSPKQLQEFVERDRAHIEAQMTKGRAS